MTEQLILLNIKKCTGFRVKQVHFDDSKPLSNVDTQEFSIILHNLNYDQFQQMKVKHLLSV
jgi:hypothetical protein